MKIDIANNIKAVELLKVEVLQNVTDMFGDISSEADSETRERILTDAARLICQTYLLAGRLGAGYDEIKNRMIAMLHGEIKNNHLLERRFGDLSKLLESVAGGKEFYEKYEG